MAGSAKVKHIYQRERGIFLSAWTFFTRLPAPTGVKIPTQSLADAVRYLPAIGLFVGASAALVFALANLFLPTTIAVLFSMLATVLLTGALHEDGLADSCDAFGGGWGKENVLAIMKDSRLGSYGALGLFFVLAGKLAALVALAPQPGFWLVLIAGHSVSRFAALTLLNSYSYVQATEHSKSETLVNRTSTTTLYVAAACGLLAPVLLLGVRSVFSVLLALFLVFSVRLYLGRYFYRRIGGFTGDCLGALQQATELTFYLALLVGL